MKQSIKTRRRKKKKIYKRNKPKNPYKKQIFGPHKDNLLFKLKGSQLQDTGSQGEKNFLNIF